MLDLWTASNDMKINKKKSGVLILRADRRTPERMKDDFKGYPILDNYKYLGLQIDNDLTLRIARDEMKTKEKKLKHLIKLAWANRLPGKLKFEAWQQLILSKM